MILQISKRIFIMIVEGLEYYIPAWCRHVSADAQALSKALIIDFSVKLIAQDAPAPINSSGDS